MIENHQKNKAILILKTRQERKSGRQRSNFAEYFRLRKRVIIHVFVLNVMKSQWRRKKRKQVKSLSRVQLLVTLWTVAHQALLSMGILQARILEWVAMPSSMGSSQPRDKTQVSCIAADCLPSESTGKPLC